MGCGDMGVGIEIYDDNGKKIFDNQQFTARLLGSFKITGDFGSKTINLDSGCNLFIYTYEQTNDAGYRRNVSITNGNQINWDSSVDAAGKSHNDTVVYYGEY